MPRRKETPGSFARKFTEPLLLQRGWESITEDGGMVSHFRTTMKGRRAICGAMLTDGGIVHAEPKETPCGDCQAAVQRAIAEA